MYDFEEEREANIARNKKLLESLGLNTNFVVVSKKKKPETKAKVANKRKETYSDDDKGDEEPAKRPRKSIAATPVDGDASEGPRRSGRNTGKKVDYKGDGENLVRRNGPELLSEQARKAGDVSEARTPMERKHDPKKFGSIPGVEVGAWWATRMECSKDAIHAPWVAGISGSPDGCYSVALSGGYEDDVDLGEAFTYTGSGGRDLKGTKDKPKNLRTAPQSFDQSFENRDNRALQKSVETGKPVRVIRGYKLHSKYAPAEGYRYDGLYTVEKAWQEKGLNPKGYLVCKFIFKRIPGQPPLPVYEEGADEAEEQSPDATAAEEDESTSETAVTSEA